MRALLGSVEFNQGIRVLYKKFMRACVDQLHEFGGACLFFVKVLRTTHKTHGHRDPILAQIAEVSVRAMGTVIFAGWRGGFGRLIIIRHSGGMKTWYGHLSTINVEPGQRVSKGTFIGRVGSSGLATGPHLHFEVRDRFGNALNPKKFLF